MDDIYQEPKKEKTDLADDRKAALSLFKESFAPNPGLPSLPREPAWQISSKEQEEKMRRVLRRPL